MCQPRLLALFLGWVGVVVAGIDVTAQSLPPPSAPRTDWTIDEVLVAALAGHPLVQAARARVSASEGARRTATTLPNPIATYWMENTRFPGQGPLAGLDREISAYATLPLEPFLQRGSRAAQADGMIRAAQATATGAEHLVALEAAHAFYRVAVAQATVDAMREHRASVGELVTYLRTRVAQGASPERELIRAEVEQDRAETEVTLADVDLVRAQAALRPFLGGPDAAPGSLRVGGFEATTDRVPLAPLSEFTAHALRERPDMLTGRAKVDAAAGAIAVERSLVVRQLGATIGVKRTAGTNAMLAGMSVTVPLFDRNNGEIQRATAERLAAEQDVSWLERTIAGEIEAAYEAAARLAARLAAVQGASLTRAEESRRIAAAAYQEGAVTLLDLLDAARAATDARLTVARLAVAARESLFELGVAAGYDAMAAARLGGGSLPPASVAGLEGGVR